MLQLDSTRWPLPLACRNASGTIKESRAYVNICFETQRPKYEMLPSVIPAAAINCVHVVRIEWHVMRLSTHCPCTACACNACTLACLETIWPSCVRTNRARGFVLHLRAFVTNALATATGTLLPDNNNNNNTASVCNQLHASRACLLLSKFPPCGNLPLVTLARRRSSNPRPRLREATLSCPR